MSAGFEIQQLVTWVRLLVLINLIHHSSWVQWNRLGLEQQLVCRTLPLSLGWISGHSSPAGSYEQFDSWGRFSHLSKPLIRSPMGRKNAFLVFTHCYRQKLGFIFPAWEIQSALGRPLAYFHTAFLLHDFLGTLFFFFCKKIFLPQFTNPGDIFAHVHSNGKTVRILAPTTFVNYWLCKKPLRQEDCKQAAWGHSMLNQHSK